ncbi:hypothetical protein D5086_001281 [Populus alba]|uniref:Uncharacterized protein n=1 Tax=Populus alba TaxID=43335 RepID=A0ACC4CY82_POPAL
MGMGPKPRFFAPGVVEAHAKAKKRAPTVRSTNTYTQSAVNHPKESRSSNPREEKDINSLPLTHSLDSAHLLSSIF